MPRKVNYGYDYDDDDYDDYYEDYEDHDIHEENSKVTTSHQYVNRGQWRCSICTYDNDESMNFCDICGVLRLPPSSSSSNSDKKTVGDMCNESRASQLAKSLFASLPQWTPKRAVTFQPQSGYVAAREANKYCTKIVPFKFDAPSPDDIISSGLRSSKTTPKDASSSVSEKNAGTTKSSASHLSTDRVKAVGGTSNVSRSKQAVEASSSSRGFLAPNTNISVSSFRENGDDESITSSMSNISVKAKNATLKLANPKRAASNTQYRPEKWMLPDWGEVGSKTQLNLAIVGHVDSGKSSLTGRLLLLLDRISQKQMHKYEKDAKLQGKGSFSYAWALDESTEERERGITMTVAVAYFDTKKYHVVVLDSPGHKDFVPNMISGATQADAAILVIDASIGAFEAGIGSSGGQTREHAQLIRSFGVDQLIVAINKMDTVQYSKERFEFIRRQVGTFLRSCGFKESLISWVPISVTENQNLVANASDLRFKSWYQGPPLLDVIDSLKPPPRDYEKPLLMPICDVIKSQSMGQVSVSGKLEAGALRSGTKVLVLPLGDIGMVRSVECNSQPVPVARAGDNVAVSLQGIDVGHVMAGGVLCHPDFPVGFASHLELKILILDVKTPILIGSQLEFHIHHAKEAARVVKIVALLDPKTGKETKKAPRCLLAKQSAVIQVALGGPVCVEEFSRCKPLGRVFLRASGRTIAVGLVTRVIEDQK